MYTGTVISVLSYVAFGILGAVSAVLIAVVAARRSAAQPVSFSKETEEKLIALIIKNPSLYIRITEVKPSDFAFPKHSEFYASLRNIYETLDYDYSSLNSDNIELKSVEFSDYITNNSQFIENFNQISEKILEENFNINKFYEESFKERDIEEARDGKNRIATTVSRIVALLKKTFINKNEENPEPRDHDAELILEYGSLVVDDSYDRTIYNGTSVIRFIDSKDNPTLVRVHAPPSKFRLFFSAMYGVLTFPLALILADNSPYGDSAFWFVAASFMLLSLFTLLWAVVDLDTMYLDMKSFNVGFVLISVTSIAAAIAANNLSLLIPGAIIAIVGLLLFEVANFLYRILRGRDGLGSGDTLILLASAGAPAALLGSLLVGYYSIFFAFVLGLIGWFFLFLRNKVSRETPFAFGPYLAFGWIASCLLYLLDKGAV